MANAKSSAARAASASARALALCAADASAQTLALRAAMLLCMLLAVLMLASPAHRAFANDSADVVDVADAESAASVQDAAEAPAVKAEASQAAEAVVEPRLGGSEPPETKPAPKAVPGGETEECAEPGLLPFDEVAESRAPERAQSSEAFGAPEPSATVAGPASAEPEPPSPKRAAGDDELNGQEGSQEGPDSLGKLNTQDGLQEAPDSSSKPNGQDDSQEVSDSLIEPAGQDGLQESLGGSGKANGKKNPQDASGSLGAPGPNEAADDSSKPAAMAQAEDERAASPEDERDDGANDKPSARRDEPATSAYAACDYSLGKLVFYRAESPDSADSDDRRQVFAGFEDETYGDQAAVPWHQCGDWVTDVVFLNAIAPTSTSYWFANFRNLKSFDAQGCLDTSAVASMRGMFLACDSLESVSFDGWDLGQLQDAEAMFEGCGSLVQLASFDTAYRTIELPADRVAGMADLLAVRDRLLGEGNENQNGQGGLGNQPGGDSQSAGEAGDGDPDDPAGEADQTPSATDADAAGEAAADDAAAGDGAGASADGFDIYVGEPPVPELNNVEGPGGNLDYAQMTSPGFEGVALPASRPESSRATQAASASRETAPAWPTSGFAQAGEVPLPGAAPSPAPNVDAARPEAVPDALSPLVDSVEAPSIEDISLGATTGAAAAAVIAVGHMAGDPLTSRMAMLVAALGLISAAAFALVLCLKVR